MLLIISFLSVIIGIISDLIRTNRMLIEDTLEHTKKMRFGKGDEYTSLTEEQVLSMRNALRVHEDRTEPSVAPAVAAPALAAAAGITPPAVQMALTQPIPTVPAGSAPSAPVAAPVAASVQESERV